MKRTVTILAVLATCSVAQAGIQWSWTNAGTGTEQGTLITDGELVGGNAPDGTYTILDFSVSSSAYNLEIGSTSGGQYTLGQPPMGFDWESQAPTVFWRSSGTYTNGIAFWVVDAAPGAPDNISLDVNHFKVHIYYGTVFLEEWTTVVLSPETTFTENASSTFGELKRLFR